MKKAEKSVLSLLQQEWASRFENPLISHISTKLKRHLLNCDSSSCSVSFYFIIFPVSMDSS